jgi:hypothetical protein
MHFVSQELLYWHTPSTLSQDHLILTSLSLFQIRIQYRISVIFWILFFPTSISPTDFPDNFPNQNSYSQSDFHFSFTGAYLADGRRQKGDRVFSAAACEVSTIHILPQLLEIAHCLAFCFEIHIRMGCICVHRYASTTGVILGLKLSLIHALKWNRLFAVWVFWLSGILCWI